ncbi:MAG: hypothetical protein HC804_02185 [Anaerolineae bacterium]|nr:hypothetical protein [Anaerolineae bacterium]
MIDPLAMDKRRRNFLQRQRATDERAENGTAFWQTQTAGDARYVQRQGGLTDERPAEPLAYEMFFDTTLGQPIWWDGSDWVDATGASA